MDVQTVLLNKDIIRRRGNYLFSQFIFLCKEKLYINYILIDLEGYRKLQLNFDSYTKISDIVFDLVFNKFTLKLNVMFNETNKNKMTSEERQENLHNEYIVQKGTITTSLKYRYSLVLEIRGDFKNSFYLDWNN